MYKKSHYYYFTNGKVVISVKQLPLWSIAELEAKFGELYQTVYM